MWWKPCDVQYLLINMQSLAPLQEYVEYKYMPQSRFYRPRSAPPGAGYSIQNRAHDDSLSQSRRWLQSSQSAEWNLKFANHGEEAAAASRLAKQGIRPVADADTVNRKKGFRINFWPKQQKGRMTSSRNASLVHR